jgi:branched-subunit amino acid ABC-type transport system permease component
VLAALAIGLVLTFRASGVVNFAHAATGTYLAFVFFELRQHGDLVLPVLGLPARIHLVDRPTVATALLVTVVLAALLGLLIYGLIFRPLRTAPPLARIVASLGLLLYLQEMVRLRFGGGGGSALFQIGDLLPTGAVRVLGVAVPTNRFVLAALAMATALVLAAVFRYTRFGLTTRAAAENERGAVLTGISPDRVAAVNWMVATVLAGVAVILIGSVTKQLDVVTTSLLVVPALAAALVGGMSSFVLTACAGLAIGMVQAALTHFATVEQWLPTWLPRTGIPEAVPFIIILVAITLRGNALPTRGALEERYHPAAPRPRHPVRWTLIGVGIATTMMVTLGGAWRLALIVSLIATVLALSSVVLTGWVGQISLAQLAIAGIAGFTTARLSADAHIPFPFSALLAITVAVGSAATAIQALVFSSEALTGGVGGIETVSPAVLGIDLGIDARGAAFPRWQFGVFVIIVVAGCVLLVANLRRSTTGLRWLAVRSNERAAAAAGIDVAAMKCLAFGVASALAGVGGVLTAYQLTRLSPDVFLVFGALATLALLYLGGVGRIAGALIAGAMASGGLLTQTLGGNGSVGSRYQIALSGVVLIVVTIVQPDGIAGAVSGLRDRVARRRAGVPMGADT